MKINELYLFCALVLGPLTGTLALASPGEFTGMPADSANVAALHENVKNTGPGDLALQKELYQESQVPGASKSAGGMTVSWSSLETGLEYSEIILNATGDTINILRIDPEYFDFVLCSAAEVGESTKALREWGEEKDLVGAINASMYLTDGLTSTGHLRYKNFVNNSRIVPGLGAFFVAGPKTPGLAPAAIIERGSPGWRQLLESYDLVAQNYRMISSSGNLLWPEGGRPHAISAIAQDSLGKILFIHTRKPMRPDAFSRELQKHLPNLTILMYVEGGAQAGLLIRTPALQKELTGVHAPTLLLSGRASARLPNVLGIKRKPAPEP